MQRTLLTEQADGTFQCTVTLTAEELPEFLRSVQRQSAPTEKPPTQTTSVAGFEAFAPMQGADGLDVRALANHAPFQRFVESTIALDEDGDSVEHALAFLQSSQDMGALIERYRAWHSTRWPGESAMPGGV